MCGKDNEPGFRDPDAVEYLKGLARKNVSGTHRIVCEHDGVSTEYWLEGGEVRSRTIPSAAQAASSMAAFEAAALSGFAKLVPNLERELGGKEVADLDGIEIAIRDVTHSSGAALYKSLLERVDAELPTPDCPKCGKPMERHRKLCKSFASRLGPVEVERTYCLCRDCGTGFFPLDRALGLEGQTATPGAVSMVADTVVSDSYEEASRKLRNLAGVKVPATTLRRWTREIGEEVQQFEREVVAEGVSGADRVYIEVDGTGVPMRRSETEGVKGKQEDGSARTREAKVIVTFTAEGTHPKTGEPTKDEGSDTLSALIDSAAAIGGISRASEFAARLDRQLCRDGVYNAQEVVLVSDGAAWITNVVDELLAGMRKTYILDVFHALEYASAALKALVTCDVAHKVYLAEVKARLLNGDVAGVIADLRPRRDRYKDVARCIDYFEANKERMRYDAYRARGMQIGSGQIESSCKQMVVTRFKRSGCKWSVRGANALMAMKSCWKNLQWEEFALWKAERIAAG